MNALVAIRALGLERDPVAVKRTDAAPVVIPKPAVSTKAVTASATQSATAAPAASSRPVSAQAAQSTAAKAAAPATTAAAKAATTTTNSTTGTRTVKTELDRDAFLQLLVNQLQNQDPMAPTDNSQMIAQLAQFSSLEQMNTLNDSFKNLKSEVDQLNFVSAGALVGRKVTGTDADGNAVSGKVDGVSMSSADGGGVSVVVGGKPVLMSNIQKIE